MLVICCYIALIVATGSVDVVGVVVVAVVAVVADQATNELPADRQIYRQTKQANVQPAWQTGRQAR